MFVDLFKEFRQVHFLKVIYALFLANFRFVFSYLCIQANKFGHIKFYSSNNTLVLGIIREYELHQNIVELTEIMVATTNFFGLVNLILELQQIYNSI